MPEERRQRLLNEGFLHIEGGLLQSDRYVLADQIAAVQEERVTLNIPGDSVISW